MKIKRLMSFGSALLVSLSSLFIIATPHAFAATKTWTGGAGDHKFSTGGNWSGGSAPVAGDALSFDTWVGPATGSSSNNIDLVNDLSSTIFGGIATSGSGSAGDYYTIDVLKVSDGATVAGSAAISLAITDLQSTGTVTIDDAVADSATVGGLVIQNGGAVNAADTPSMTIKSGSELIGSITSSSYSYTNVDAITIEKGAKLYLCGSSGVATIASNITFGGGSGANPEIRLEPCMGGGSATFSSAGAEFTGTITLLSDATLTASNKRFVVKGTLVPNGHTLTVNAGDGSKVMGNGTTGSVSLASGSIIAPGLSPGCLNTGNLTMVSGSTYDFELGGTTACTEYDQIKVIGVVDLGSGTLNTILYNGFKPQVGQSFTIIDNDSSDAVTGTFANLSEGATFTVDGYVFKVTYKGGDGNDVVLTVQSLPGTPNAGFMVVKNNPVLTLFVTIFAAGGILLTARRYSKATSRR